MVRAPERAVSSWAPREARSSVLAAALVISDASSGWVRASMVKLTLKWEPASKSVAAGAPRLPMIGTRPHGRRGGLPDVVEDGEDFVQEHVGQHGEILG